MDVFLHTGYAVRVDAVADYFAASMDMLDPDARASLFPADRPVRTKERADVSTYYGEHAHVENCLVADGCFIEGTVTDCILFRGVRVARGAHLSRCIVMQDTCIAADAILQYAIADKNVRIGPAVTLTGCEALPIVIPKAASSDPNEPRKGRFDFMPMTNQISRDELRGAIADKLSAHFGVTAENATDEQVFQAAAIVIREILSRLHTFDSRTAPEREVHYLSMEFLMGRSLMKTRSTSHRRRAHRRARGSRPQRCRYF